ncbi:hypothetical protein ACFW2Y_18100 [Streptomyces sp. NPDC058877]|uniref:hypothetical protein n=1 Tax=unclassified Streptomyces TaxID=2593676 RepID=UPI003688F452
MHRLVNLTGPLGSGKTWMAARLGSAVRIPLDRTGAPEAIADELAEPSADVLVVDDADRSGDLVALRDVLDRAGDERPSVVVLSRRPLRSTPGWTDAEVCTVPVRPLPDSDIDALATAAGIDSPAGRALVTSLAEGIPLLAESACRALHDGVPTDAPGAVADHVAGEIFLRLGRESPVRHWQDALRSLAAMGAGDEKMLGTGPEPFTVLAGLSLVTRTALGLALSSPYREVLELAHRWRRPVEHDALRNEAVRYRAAQLRTARTPTERFRIVEQGLFLSGDPFVRRLLRPMAPSPATIRPVDTSDATEVEEVGRLLHRWARHGGFHGRRSDRLVERWLSEGTADFVIARDPEERPVGVANLTVIRERTIAGVEPLLQQHAARFLCGEAPAGLFIGAVHCPDPPVRAQILRHTLALAVRHGRTVASTASPDYQRLLNGLRFRPHGAVREDVHGSGRHPEVFSNDMSPGELPSWLDRLTEPHGVEAGPADPDTRAVGRALRQIDDPVALARSPLLAPPHDSDPASLRAWLYDAVRALAESPSRTEAEAGRVLQTYYLRRCGSHDQVAARLHLSRATYFRRLRYGLLALGTRYVANGP